MKTTRKTIHFAYRRREELITRCQDDGMALSTVLQALCDYFLEGDIDFKLISEYHSAITKEQHDERAKVMELNQKKRWPQDER